uniref:Uncharacterized protein n=1 Tax=Strigamia maritima TaxID=126957 RepID=T1J1V2_STRMM
MAQVEDDCVEYFLFPRLPTVKCMKNVLDDLRLVYQSYLAKYLDDYIWQKDSFSLTPVNSPADATTPPHLHGSTRFGCNVDDEWFVVFLLFELTKAFPDLVIRVIDNDNEFLLIEMAEQIPKWLNPETAVNRVYIHQGHVQIIPRSSGKGPLSSLPTSDISVSEAVAAVREHSTFTKCDANTQRALVRRLGAFPDKMRENVHRAHCFLPATAAAILKEAPPILALVVNAFVDRSQSDLQVCRMMKYFPPETRVLQRVRFTKCLYAQLLSDRFEVDSRVGWKMPPARSPSFKSYDLGMKIACGFEMLVHAAKQSAKRNGSMDEKDPRWSHYVANLRAKGYFQDELEGSKVHQQLMNNAKRHFIDDLLAETRHEQRILQLFDNVHVDLDELQREANSLPPADDDGWMDLSVRQLDDILRNKWGDNGGDNVGSKVATAVTASLNSFVNHRSDVEGAEFPTKLRKETKRGNKSNRVTLDPDSFADAMTSILDFKVPEWEEGSSSDMSEYSDEGEDDELKSSKSSINGLKTYMESMDRELSQTAVGQSFERAPQPETETETDFDHYSPVDVDLTALCNILESYRSQGADPGPASNLLSSMGVQIPRNSDD